MSRWCAPRFLLAALLAGLFAAAPPPARAEEGAKASPKIYRWIDQNGIAHYTTDPGRIPGALRSKIPDAAPTPLPPAEAEAPATGAPAAAASQGQAPTAAPSGPDAWAADNRGTPATPPAGPPARSLATQPFSEGSAAGSAGAAAPGTVGAPAPANAPAAKPEAAIPPGAKGQSALDDLDYRIASLQTDIQADEKIIASRLGSPKGGGPLAAGDDPKFREAALRLPERLKELKKLQEERAKLVGPGSGS